MRHGRATYLTVAGALLIMAVALGKKAQEGRAVAEQTAPVPEFKVDPFWPKPLPEMTDAEGRRHRWITGEIGGTCVDSHDHIFTLNRGWQNSSLGKLHVFEAMSGIPAPPVIAYDAEGNVALSWGDASLVEPNGGTKVMPESLHGCFADYEDNIWIGGNADGVVQKYSQWGSPGSGPGQFALEGGGHPHCVILGNDGLVYTCDRGNARVQVFDKMGVIQRAIPIDPKGYSYQPLRTNDIAFSGDQPQTFFYTSDVGSGTVWILNRAMGGVVGGIGSMGHYAGQFIGVHTMATDSKGNLYVSEGGGGRRTQKFVKQ